MKKNSKKTKMYFIEEIQDIASKINTANEALTFLNGVFQQCYARNMDELKKVCEESIKIENELREKFSIAEERDGMQIIAGAKEHFYIKA